MTLTIGARIPRLHSTEPASSHPRRAAGVLLGVVALPGIAMVAPATGEAQAHTRTPPPSAEDDLEAARLARAILFKNPGPASMASDPRDPLGSGYRKHAERALEVEPTPNPKNRYVREKVEARAALERLGLVLESHDRIHIDDVNKRHGGEVARTAAGRTALARRAEVSLNYEGVPSAWLSHERTSEDVSSAESFDRRLERALRKNAGLTALARLAAEGIVQTVHEKRMRLENIRLHTPEDGRKTFVNMSWGETAHEAAERILEAMASAAPSSKLRQEVRHFLGHDPASDLDVTRVFQRLVYPSLARVIATAAHQGAMALARQALAEEIERSQARGIVFFEAAGNAFQDATRLGRPEFSLSETTGVPGRIKVGAVELNGPGPEDDRVAAYSSGGDVSITAPGTAPVELRRGRAHDVFGTSYASPAALDVGVAMASVNPTLSAADITRLITDPRATRDLPGDRDGHGHVDPFAAILLAKNPSLTRAQIDAARAELRSPHADLPKLRSALGLWP